MLDLRYRTIFLVALPLMGTSFIQSIVLLTDAAFLSRYSTLAYDACGNAGMIYITLFVAMQGIGDGSQIVHARRIGEKRYGELGSILGTTLWTNLFLACILFFGINFFISEALVAYSRHYEIALAQGSYIGIRSYALFFHVFGIAANAYLFAKGQTWKVLVASLITASSNIFLDYCLIFGNFGFQEMGLEGAAWASTLADGLGALAVLILLFIDKENFKIGLFSKLKFEFTAFQNLFKVSSPLMLQGFLALSTWTVFFTWIEQIGIFELTVSQNIRAVYFIALIPIWGFSSTTKTYISQYMGNNQTSLLPKIQKRIQLLTMICLIVLFHGAFFYPETLISWINPKPTFLEKSGQILRMVAPSILLYGFVSVYFQTINASGNTKFTLVIETVCVALYLLTAYLLIKVNQSDIFVVWFVEYVYFGSLGVLSYLYLKMAKWQNKII